MSKRKKSNCNPIGISCSECEIRPVTRSDKWCQRKLPRGKEPIGDAPFGYIVTVPYLPNQNTFLDNIDGYIVRSKKHCGNLLLQVIKKDGAPQYGVKSFTRHEPNVSSRKRKKKKKLYRILNIRDLRKSEGKW